MFENLIKWINSEISTQLNNILVDLPTVQKELSNASALQKQSIITARLAKLTQIENDDTKKTFARVSECTSVVAFLEYSKRELEKKNQETPLFLLALGYLLSLPQGEEPANYKFKIQTLFSTLLEENTTLTLEYYSQNKELFNTHTAIKQLAEKTLTLSEGTQKVQVLSRELEYKLAEQKNPLGLVFLFKNLISETEEFATVILWLVNRGVPVNDILQTQLLHDFMGYHLFDLDSANSAIHYFYQLLNQFPKAAELIAQVKITSCSFRGFQSYALDGKLQNNSQLQTIEPKEPVLEFTPVLANFNALHELFGSSFLDAALSWGADSANAKWLTLLKTRLNQINALPELINNIAKEKPQLLRLLTSLLDNHSIEQLIETQNGALMHLLAYRPRLLDKIGNENIATYLEEIVNASSSAHDLVTQLSALLKGMLASRHSATELVFDKLIDCLYQNTHFLEDFELIRQLKKFTFRAHNLSLRSENLQRLMEESIAANTTEAVFTAQHYHHIEDMWLNTSAKLRVLNEIQPSLNSESYSKHSLYIRIAQSFFAKHGRSFDLNNFIAALELPDINTVAGASLHERLYIEILSAIDDEQLRASLIELLVNEPLNSTDWLEKNYGGQSLFIKAAEHGNTGLLNLILANREQSHTDLESVLTFLISEKNSEAVNLLCRVLGERLSKKTMISAFAFSAQQGQLDTLKQLSEIENFQLLSRKQIAQAIEQAVINGHFEVTKYLCELPSYSLMKHTVAKLFKLAVKFRDQDILTFLCSIDNPPMQVQIDKAFNMAVAVNDLDIIKCFCNLPNNAPGKKIIEKEFLFAASLGHLAIVKYLGNLTHPKLSQPASDEALISAAADGQVAVVSHLKNQASKAAVGRALLAAIKGKQWDTASMLCDTSETETTKLKQAINASLILAGKAGDLFSLKFICQLPIHPSKQAIEQVLSDATKIGNLAVIRYLHLTFPTAQKSIDNMLIEAVKERHPAIVYYLCEELPLANTPRIEIMNSSVKKAISTKQPDIANYLRLQLNPFDQEQLEELAPLIAKENRVSPYPYLNRFGIFARPQKSLADSNQSSPRADISLPENGLKKELC